jgi:two-component system NtrC family sensor kinase
MRCSRCQQENPAGVKFCGGCGTPFQRLVESIQPPPSYADVQRSLTEALEQQTATAEILRVISTSPTNLQPVLDAVVKSAAHFCGAPDASLFRLEGEALRADAHHGPVSQPPGFLVPVVRGSVAGRSVLERRAVGVTDLQGESEEFPEGIALARQTGQRATLSVPLLREGAPIGVILLRRAEAVPFSDKQIVLLQTFADQAVIAIENVRLFKELQEKNQALTRAHAQASETLEQQTATAEILRVIAASPTELQPAFDAIVRNAANVCGAFDAILALAEGDDFVTPAHHGPIPPPAIGKISMRGTVTGQAIRGACTVHVADLLAAEDFPIGRELAREIGYRTVLCVPLLRDGAAIGAIGIRRTEVRPFADKQISLLQTFADQAVIAIENVRLFKELESRNRDLTQALEQQTATSEVLRVISSSPTAVEPVFHAIVTSGRRLCHANQCLLVGFDGEMLTWLASDNFSMAREEVLRSIFPYRPTRAGTTGRVVLDRAVVHIPDVMDDPDHGFKDVSMRAGARAQLAVPMFHENQVIGALHVSRPEPGPFSDDQIALLKTFADQAVIAIENVRLFNETREALERQTATSEILRVISSSPTNTQPVFDVIAANAARLCVARDAQVLRVEGDVLRLVSAYGSPSMPPVRAISRGHAVGRAVIDRQTIHVRDMAQAVAEFPETSSPQHGVESLLAVPLLREDVAVGVIRVSRTQIQPFTEQQIALLRTFADQAVIAIENVRLFTELQEKNRALTQAHGQVTEALEQQTATSEVLRVIAGSPTDLQPVLDALVESAGRLCQAADTFLLLVEGDQLRVTAFHGSVGESAGLSNTIHRG